jgi:hypothetical protein
MTTLTTRAAFAPATYDADERTVELVWTTGARVRRVDWVSGREFDEELEVSARAIDLSRLNQGAPLLDSHDQNSLDSLIGVVERAWVDGKEGRALVRFSGRAGAIADDVRAGIIRNVSVGYRVLEWAEVEDKRAAVPVRRAVKWQPHELSLVPVPADAAAQVRGAEPGLDAPAIPAAPPATHQEITMSEQPIDTRAAETAAPVPASPGLGDYERIAASTRGILGAEWAAGQFRAGASLEAARDAAIDAVAAAAAERGRAPAPAAIAMGRSGDDPAEIRAAMADALVVRAMPGFRPSGERFREFASLRISDMLIEMARANGENVGVRDRSRLIERALHTTSDFPLLLENAGNKMLEAGFAAAAPSYRSFFAQRSFNDFKPHSFLTAGDFPALDTLNEGGEIKQGTISEKRERITPTTYARSVSVTRQMLVNDDLGAFTDFGTMIGRRVADQENAIAYALVNTASGDGPTLTTGNAAVFGTAAARANKASAGAAIAEATLDAGHAAIMSQTSIDGIRLNLMPRYILTGAAYRGAALRFTTRITADAGTNVGLYSNLTPIADANITGNRWYLFADPAAAPVYVYGYVGGQNAPSIRVWNPTQGRDGLSVEVVHDFAVGAIDHRGGWFNPGA